MTSSTNIEALVIDLIRREFHATVGKLDVGPFGTRSSPSRSASGCSALDESAKVVEHGG
jgi:hypothetical protein